MEKERRRADEELYQNIREIAEMKGDLSHACKEISEVKTALFSGNGIEKRIRRLEIWCGGVTAVAGFVAWWIRSS